MADIFGPADATNAVTTRPADPRNFTATDTWFKNCTTPATPDGTAVEAEFYNEIIANLRGLARGNGNTAGGSPVVAGDNSDGMLLAAVQHLAQRGLYGRAGDTGAVNALVVTLAPVPAELTDGMAIGVRALFTNTGPTTLTVNGVKLPVRTPANAACVGGEVVVGAWQVYRFDLTNQAWQVTSPIIVKPGRLLNIQVFSTVGTTSYTRTPGAGKAIVIPHGGGAAGGGAPAVSGQLVGAGAPGGSGAWGVTLLDLSTVTDPVPVTIGAGGVPVTGGAGGNGGSTSFGSYITAQGGNGGQIGGPTSVPYGNGGYAVPVCSGGNIVNGAGEPGGLSLGLSYNSGAYGGQGASGLFGGGGAPVNSNVNGLPARAPGAAGGGTATSNGNGALTGGYGFGGILFVIEYTAA